MADKIAKLLAKLSKKDLERIQKAIEQIVLLQFEGLDIKTLKGRNDTFRVRTGNYRIIFGFNQNKQPYILSISRRNEKTYKDF
jgi:mRNA-degrading endonuclease RelE of RelBE toxin-antitoxin system